MEDVASAVQKRQNRWSCRFGWSMSGVGPRDHVFDVRAYGRHLANIVEQ